MINVNKKRAQEEMIGFGLIIIIVAVIMIIFLWFYLMKPTNQNFNNYEAENFVTTALQYTTDCKEPGRDYLDLKELISWCYDLKECENGNSCSILNSTIKGILEESWDVGTGKRIQGYEFKIGVFRLEGDLEREIFSQSKGNLTINSRGYIEEYPKNRKWIKVSFSMFS